MASQVIGLAVLLVMLATFQLATSNWELDIRQDDTQPLSRIALHRSIQKLDDMVSITASPALLGQQGETAEWVTVTFKKPLGANETDWIGVFSPATFNASECLKDLNPREYVPFLCSSPIKYKYANFSSTSYVIQGEGFVKFRLIKQRADFAFGFFSGDITNGFDEPVIPCGINLKRSLVSGMFDAQPVLEAVSNTITFSDVKAPVYPRLALGSAWDEMTITWTSGYGKKEAEALVQWGPEEGKEARLSPATTLTFTRHDMCGPPARTIGWRDPGFFHTAYLRELWPSTKYYYKVGHKSKHGGYTWGRENSFISPPLQVKTQCSGLSSLSESMVDGHHTPGTRDMGKIVAGFFKSASNLLTPEKCERDGSNEYNQYQHGALNTTDQLIKDIEHYDLVFHIGDLSYANGYMSEWDQFHEQVSNITARVPYMVTSGNHERDYPGSGSFFQNMDSGGECGVPTQIMYHMPTRNKAKSWYVLMNTKVRSRLGMFHFCVGDTEMDWREGTEQYKFLEECFQSVDRQRQPWLIFLAHRVLGYSSGSYYGLEGTFAEPYGRESLQKLWQKYKVDLALYGHVHNYERTCPVYESQCVTAEKELYSGRFNATIHVVAGGGGCDLSDFSPYAPFWSLVKDMDFGFTKLTAFNHSTLLFEYMKSRDGEVHDQFWINRNYRDILGCDGTLTKNCPEVILAS